MTTWNRFLDLLSLPRTPHTRDNNRIPILCVGRLRWIWQVSFRAYWLERSCPSCPVLFLLSRSLLPSFLLQVVTTLSSVDALRKKSSFPAVTVRILCSRDLARICIRANYLSLVRDLPSSNMLEAAISVYSFRSISQTRPCALRMSRYVAFITFTSAGHPTVMTFVNQFREEFFVVSFFYSL